MENENCELIITQEIVRNLWKWNNFLNLYSSFLNGNITRKEFDKETDMYNGIEKNKLTNEQLEKAISYVRSLLPYVEPDDIADLLNVEYNDIKKLINEK